MKKVLLSIVVILVLVIGVVIGLLFTKAGNALIQSIVELKLNEQLPLKAHFNRFTLFPLNIELVIGKETSIKAKGGIDLFSQKIDIVYGVAIKDLASLEPLTKEHIRGPFHTKGKIVGELNKFDLEGLSDVASSNTAYKVKVEEFDLKRVDVHIKSLKLEKLLYMLYQPLYTQGNLDAVIKMTNLELNELGGDITTFIKGKSLPDVIAKEFGIKEAKIAYTLKQTTHIKDAKAQSNISFVSNVANADIKDAFYDIEDATFKAPYVVSINDLGKLYFLTQKRMRGRVIVNGLLKKGKHLLVTAKTHTLGGDIDAKLLDNKLKADAKGIDVVSLTDMLYYPKMFDSSVDANVEYDLVSKKGRFKAIAKDGRILPNQMTFLLAQMAKFDITKEIYKITTLSSRIDDQTIISDLDMVSRLTHITSKDALVDLKKEVVDAKLQIDIKDRLAFVKIKGDIKSPKISIDAKALIKARVKKELIKRFKNKLPSEVKGLLNLFH